MIALSGQLGNGALGAFELARPRTASVFVPHRGRARSVLSAAVARSALTGRRVRSAISAPDKAGSEVGNG